MRTTEYGGLGEAACAERSCGATAGCVRIAHRVTDTGQLGAYTLAAQRQGADWPDRHRVTRPQRSHATGAAVSGPPVAATSTGTEQALLLDIGADRASIWTTEVRQLVGHAHEPRRPRAVGICVHRVVDGRPYVAEKHRGRSPAVCRCRPLVWGHVPGNPHPDQ